MEKRWVFTELVKSNKDTVGFLAYSLYKFEKNEYAETLKKQNKRSYEIDKAMKSYHEIVTCSQSRIDNYRKSAEQIIEKMVDNLSDQVRAEYESQLSTANEQAAEITRLKAEIQANEARHVNEIKDAEEQAILRLHRSITAKESKKTHWTLKMFLWQWSGFSGVFATIIFAVLVYGACAMLLSKEKQSEIIASALENVKSSFTQQPSLKADK